MIITVTDLSEPCGPISRDCPVARAINNVLRPPYRSGVGFSMFYLSEKDNIVFDATLPVEAEQFIQRYTDRDLLHVPVPISFELDIPPEYLKEAV